MQRLAQATAGNAAEGLRGPVAQGLVALVAREALVAVTAARKLCAARSAEWRLAQTPRIPNAG